MIPGIGTLINGFGVIISGILARIIFKKELKNFEENTKIYKEDECSP